MIGFDEACALISQAARPLGAEQLPLAEAHRRILATPVSARVDSPPQDSSAMDGYAVRDADLAELPARIPVGGRSFAGEGLGFALEPRQCVRIFTGAPIPPGADRVVIQEQVSSEGDFAVFEAPLDAGRHIRRRGSDFKVGDELAPAGRLLDARAIVAVAAADVGLLDVWRRPRVAVVSTGNELVEPGRAGSRPGAIPESVSYGVAALAEAWGAQLHGRIRLPDELPALQMAAGPLLEQADLIVVTGGASVGERDHAKAMFEPAGLELIFSKVAIKPGKPVWFGRVAGRLVLGLPGNPTSALVTGRLFLAPLLSALTGRGAGAALDWRQVRLSGQLDSVGGRETFVRAACARGCAKPLTNQDSSAQKALVDASYLIRRSAGAPAASAGELVEAIDF